MKCFQCNHDMNPMDATHRYDESGLRNVLLMDIPMYKCSSCGETEIEIPAMEELHDLLGLLVVLQQNPLSSDQVKYLRKHIGYSQEELASALGTTRASIARWEGKNSITLASDKQLRQWYLNKKIGALKKLPLVKNPEVFHKLALLLLEKMPPKNKKLSYKLRKEDWVPDEEGHLAIT